MFSSGKEGKSSLELHVPLLADHDREDALVHPEMHSTSANAAFVKSIVYGGLDGIITIFSIVATSVGANLSVHTVLVVGWASLLADALSMGLGDWLSEQAEGDYVLSMQENILTRLRKDPEGMKEEVRSLYVKRGMPAADAGELVGIFSQYEKAFVDLMMVVLEEQMPAESTSDAWKHGIACFASFMLFGSVPLFCYVVFSLAEMENGLTTFIISAVFTGIATFVLGTIKGSFSITPWYMAGTEMLLTGMVANAIAYTVGWALEQAFGLEESRPF